MNRLLLLPLILTLLLLTSCGEAGPSGVTATEALEQPSMSGVEYRGEVLACAYEVGLMSAGRGKVPLFDCDFRGFYKEHPELLAAGDWSDFKKSPLRMEWVRVGEAPLMCIAALTFPPADGRRARGAYGAACDWARWRGALTDESKPPFEHLPQPEVTGFPYRGESLPCAVDVLDQESFWDSKSVFSCDFEGFYETYPDLLLDSSTEENTTVENTRFARWVRMGDEALYCLNSFRYEEKTTTGAACDWPRWHGSLPPR